MIATIHVRMTMILHPEGYTRWLSDSWSPIRTTC